MLPPLKELEALIEQAMKANAPSMHRSLRADGTLPKVLESRALAAKDSYETAVSAALTEATRASRNLPGPERESELKQARNQAAQTALAQAVEFAESPPENEEPTSLRRAEA
jgi:hypothetical protein